MVRWASLTLFDRASLPLFNSVAFVTTILVGLASNSDWGDPWVDPQGILGGSSPDSGDPAILTLVKIGGSSETTFPLYNIKRGDHGEAPASLRIFLASRVAMSFWRLFCSLGDPRQLPSSRILPRVFCSVSKQTSHDEGQKIFAHIVCRSGWRLPTSSP